MQLIQWRVDTRQIKQMPDPPVDQYRFGKLYITLLDDKWDRLEFFGLSIDEML